MKNNPFGEVKFERKPSGAFLINGEEVAHTIQCGHCGCHFVSVKGSGKVRGFCLKCMKATCGKVECDICITSERKLEIIELGGLI